LLALPTEGDFIAHALFDEEFVLAVPLAHTLTKRKTVRFSDLEDKTLLLLEDGHCLREQALAVCHKARAHEARNFRATSLETLRHMVATGVGMTLMPKLSCRVNDGIHYLPFISPKPKRTIGIIWRPSSAKKKILEQILNNIKNIAGYRG
jgi:LysR family hydrogen peroxide-inducible transcriptional activator